MSNYLPFCGYGFYGALSSFELASYFSSWGLLATAPITGMVMAIRTFYYRMRWS